MKLVVDSKVRCKDKKVSDVLCQKEVGDKSTHPLVFPPPVSKGKTQRWKVSLKISACGARTRDLFQLR